MAKKSRKYDAIIRMGATNYDLTVLIPEGRTLGMETINYDMSTMTKKERNALIFSLVSSYRQCYVAKAA